MVAVVEGYTADTDEDLLRCGLGNLFLPDFDVADRLAGLARETEDCVSGHCV